MGVKEKVKMCPFCEGNVPFEAEDCRYCGSSFSKGARKVRTPYQTEDSLAGLYQPPYSPDKTSSRFGITAPHETMEEVEAEPVEAKKKEKRVSPKVSSEESSKLGSILLLSIGGWLFTLAFLLFFLSDQGKVALEWKSKYWPIYLISAVLFLYQGFKKLKSAPNSSE